MSEDPHTPWRLAAYGTLLIAILIVFWRYIA